MRALQCDILHMLHYKIRKIREMPKEAHELANYIEYLIPFIHEKMILSLKLVRFIKC